MLTAISKIINITPPIAKPIVKSTILKQKQGQPAVSIATKSLKQK